MDRAGVPNVVWMSNQTFPWGNDCVKPYWFVVGSAHCWVVYSLIVEDKAVQFDQWLSASPFYSLSSIPVFILEGPLPAPLMMKKPRDLDRLVWEISSGWMSLSSFSSLLSIPYPLLPLFSTLLFSFPLLSIHLSCCMSASPLTPLSSSKCGSWNDSWDHIYICSWLDIVLK